MDVDDTRPRRAAAVVRALNHPSAGGLRPVVITCRTSRYQQLSAAPDSTDDVRPAGPEATSNASQREAVQDATVVGVEPLSVQRVVSYLTYRFRDPADPASIEPRWRPIIDRLTASGSSGDPLLAALGSPLRLFLTVTSYRHAASRPDELTRFGTADQIDDHLFARLVPAALTQHPPTDSHYTAASVTGWLTTLARHLTWQGEHGDSHSDLWLHQLWQAAGERAPRYTAAALMTSAAATPYFSIAVLGRRVTGGDVLVVGTVVAAVAWRTSRRTVDLQRLDLTALRTPAGRRRIRRLFVSRGTFGFKIGLAFGFPFGAAYAVAEDGLVRGLQLGLGVGVVFGTVLGLAGGLASALATRPPAIDRPSRLVRQGLVHLVTVIVAVGLVIGLMIGLVAAVNEGPINGLVFGSVWTLWLGLPVGFVFVASSPWPRFLVATMILARRGDLPRRPAVFLDWAYGAGLMRLSGIAVQFRHREFQTWLTTRSQPTAGRAAAVVNTGWRSRTGSRWLLRRRREKGDPNTAA